MLLQHDVLHDTQHNDVYAAAAHEHDDEHENESPSCMLCELAVQSQDDDLYITDVTYDIPALRILSDNHFSPSNDITEVSYRLYIPRAPPVFS